MVFVCWLGVTLFLRETYSPVLLRHRARELRKETGDHTIMTEQERMKRTAKEIMKIALLRPLQMLVFEPIITCFSVGFSFPVLVIHLMLNISTGLPRVVLFSALRFLFCIPVSHSCIIILCHPSLIWFNFHFTSSYVFAVSE